MGRVLAGVVVRGDVVTFVTVATHFTHVVVADGTLVRAASDAVGFEPPPATMVLDPFTALIPSEETRAMSITAANNTLATSTEAIVRTEWTKRSGDSFIDFSFWKLRVAHLAQIWQNVRENPHAAMEVG